MDYEQILNFIHTVIQEAKSQKDNKIKNFWWFHGEIIHLPSNEAVRVVVDCMKEDVTIINMWYPYQAPIHFRDKMYGKRTETAAEQVAKELFKIGASAA